MNLEEHGTPLLQVRPAAFHLIISLVAGPPLLIGGIFAMFDRKMSGTGMLMVVFGAGLLWMGVRLIRRRPVLMEVTDRGIMIWSKAEAINVSFSLLKDLFVPWERLEYMRFLSSKQIWAEHLSLTVGRGPYSPGFIALKLRMDPFWPPPGTIRGGIIMQRAKPGEIYIRTVECSPSGERLWKEMTALAAKYGGTGLVLRG